MNPTTLQKVLQELGISSCSERILPRTKACISRNIETLTTAMVALIISEIEEALKEEGFDTFVYRKITDAVKTEHTASAVNESALLFLDGRGEIKLAASCDMFLKSRGVEI